MRQEEKKRQAQHNVAPRLWYIVSVLETTQEEAEQLAPNKITAEEIRQFFERFASPAPDAIAEGKEL